jgi:nicotinamide phosphoribosyltransferase
VVHNNKYVVTYTNDIKKQKIMKTIVETRKRFVKKRVTNELNGINELLDKFPTGILSMVSDTFDIWRMCTEYLPILKDKIMSRDGKLVIRPDSGNPADIVCGYNTAEVHDYHDYNVFHPSYKGVVELLWDVFGGSVNDQGYKVLDSHIGVIYGDSITLERAEEICKRLESKGFASTNIVFGVGSFTYQYNTRDTFGFAMKATYVELMEEDESVTSEIGNPVLSYKKVGREIFKNPITDDGTKKSATGLLHVHKNENNEYSLIDKVTWKDESEGELKSLYKDGEFTYIATLEEIRNKMKSYLK